MSVERRTATGRVITRARLLCRRWGSRKAHCGQILHVSLDTIFLFLVPVKLKLSPTALFHRLEARDIGPQIVLPSR
jgi:hypothetical protein